MKKIIRSTLIIMVLTVFSFASICHALETDTHEIINEHIARNTVIGFSLDSYLKNQLGMHGGVNQIFDSKYVWRWMRDGGKYEDKPPMTLPYRRSFNHSMTP